uniref:Uncharacterized protein n=1 Tax=Anopheles epiroticus TaxID=199890 RepID=A0A182PVZ5_9DIPT
PYHNFFCVNCIPKPTATQGGNTRSLFQEGCLFDNEEFLSTFRGYECYNPHYELYSKTNRVIITESCYILPNYKRIARKPMPAIVKMRKLIEIFPAVHQMPFKKYDSMQAMYSDVRKKYREIRNYYSTNNTGSFMDFIDLMVERTPLVRPSASDRTRRLREIDTSSSFPSETLQIRENSEESTEIPSSVSDASTLHISSQSVGEEPRVAELPLPDSQQSAAATVLSTLDVQQSSSVSDASTLHISSQSVGEEPRGEEVPLPESQQSTASTVINTLDVQQSNQFNISSQDANIESVLALPLSESVESLATNIELDSLSPVLPTRVTMHRIHDSQEAGPSGLQQQQPRTQETPSSTTIEPSTADGPQPKRRRLAIPVNMTPEQAQRTKQVKRWDIEVMGEEVCNKAGADVGVPNFDRFKTEKPTTGKEGHLETGSSTSMSCVWLARNVVCLTDVLDLNYVLDSNHVLDSNVLDSNSFQLAV